MVSRSVGEGVSRSALAPRSKRPRTSPGRTPRAIEEAIVSLRKELGDLGLDNGPRTIAWHLGRRGLLVPAESTISRILRQRGFVIPQPAKRPKSSFVRFEAALPNECWQADVTHWRLATGAEVEILNIIDDHSRLCVAADVRVVTDTHDVLESFARAALSWGWPASVLTDNAAIFNARARKGRTVFEGELERLGIVYKHSRPYPQTWGKIERFHQTMKKYLVRRRPVRTVRASGSDHHLCRALQRRTSAPSTRTPHPTGSLRIQRPRWARLTDRVTSLPGTHRPRRW